MSCPLGSIPDASYDNKSNDDNVRYNSINDGKGVV